MLRGLVAANPLLARRSNPAFLRSMRSPSNSRECAAVCVRISKRTLALPPSVSRRAASMEERHRKIIASWSTTAEDELGGSSDDDDDSDASSSKVMSNMSPAERGRELSRVAHVSNLNQRLSSLLAEVSSLEELLHEAEEEESVEDGDTMEDMKQECLLEIERARGEISGVEQLIVDAVLPRDDDDTDADAIMEIRAGTGGDEASLFASELLATYEKTARQQGWSAELLSVSTTDLGGVREAALSVTGGGSSYGSETSYTETGGDDLSDSGISSSSLGPYGFFKWESGVHRVQRVPVNDAKIHTSTASVAVLPAPKQSKSSSSSIPLSELKVETFRASGAGGQHVNTTESAVRVTHIPTGVTAAIQDERSQHKNKAKAMRLIEARVADQRKATQEQELGETRRSLMGGGTRSERIRTYNFPQDRVTDHRAGMTEHGVEGLMASSSVEGGLVAVFAPALRRMWREEMLQEMEMEEEVNSSKEEKKSRKKSKNI